MIRLRRYLPLIVILLPLIFVCGQLLLAPIAAHYHHPRGIISPYLRVLGGEHVVRGWPWAFQRDDSGPSMHGLKWSFTQHTEFSLWLLLADVACLSAGIIIVGILLLRHFRRRGGWFRFSLRELFALTTVVALAAGWWMYILVAWKSETTLIAELEEQRIIFGNLRYCGPQWIRRLVGDQHLEMFSHPYSIDVRAEATRESWSLLERSISRLPHSLHLNVTRIIPDWAIDWSKFAGIEEIRFSLSGVHDGILLGLDSIPTLKALQLNGCSISNDGLAHLANCAALEELDLGVTHVNDDGMAHLRGLMRLRKLDLSGTGVSDAGVAQLAPLTALRELSLAGAQTTDACLRVLQKLPHLEVLNLSFVPLTDSGARQLLEFPSLKSISLPERSSISDETLGLLRERIENVYVGEPLRL